MASTKEFRDYILEQLDHKVTYRPMMGEYLLYYEGILFGGIYDDRLLIKKVETNKMYHLPEEVPYKGAKAMYFIEDLENKESLIELVLKTCEAL